MADEVVEKVVPVVPPTPAVEKKEAKEPKEKDEAWVGERLERARSALLKEMGVKDLEAAKAAIKAANEADEANKTAAQKAAELTTKLTAADAERNRLLAITTEHAARMIGVLTPAQQKAVRDVAGEDPALQLKTIGALAPTWAADEAKKAPAASAPPATAPAAVVPGATPDHKTAYTTMKQTNPFAAAAYGMKNEAEVYK